MCVNKYVYLYVGIYSTADLFDFDQNVLKQKSEQNLVGAHELLM